MRVVLTLLLLIAVSPARADWVGVSETDTTVLYVDPSTIRKDGHLRKVWVLSNLKQRDTTGELSRRALDEYDCAGERRRLLSISTHAEPMAAGQILLYGNTSGVAGEWNYIPPGTSFYHVLKFVCDR